MDREGLITLFVYYLEPSLTKSQGHLAVVVTTKKKNASLLPPTPPNLCHAQNLFHIGRMICNAGAPPHLLQRFGNWPNSTWSQKISRQHVQTFLSETTDSAPDKLTGPLRDPVTVLRLGIIKFSYVPSGNQSWWKGVLNMFLMQRHENF